MNAGASGEDTARCIEAGMTDFLAKPFDPEAMFAIVLKGIGPEAQAGS